MITAYHAKLYAHELTRRYSSDSIELFTSTLLNSQVDLNPHQVDAALFAFRSPFSNGAILADEVGLGKTIEAGIVLAQKWAERKRHILIITPSSLRKQWHQELQDKFYLPSSILEGKSFNLLLKENGLNPFDSNEILICSYPFARNKAEYLKKIDWNLVVIDEAHRLRNVYKPGNKIARELRDALNGYPKLLLTATPLQNSLMELYGLTSFIDNFVFGDMKIFRNQFAKLSSDANFDELKHRLKPICKRTLRRQVLEYIRYTERKPHTQEFVPTKDEEMLYDLVSEYLRRDKLQALPSGQRNLMTLVLRKLLSSSTFAIAGALDSLATKLERKLKENSVTTSKSVPEYLEEDFEEYEELSEEFEEESDITDDKLLSDEDIIAIQNEIAELRNFYEIAMKITNNAKGEALLTALEAGFRMTAELGGKEKAVIFTESRRTQNYLLQILSENGYKDEILLFNGTNTDLQSKAIYTAWNDKHKGTDYVTGSRSADTRAALVDYFRSSAKIMIATEAAAEGINLQFCSMVVNYDLPWNPQRIEQRIGRCHRYGQLHDVVVINFLNKSNAADQRVYELLRDKFQLFSGVFGASDEVLGTIESGVDFERRIVEIYQSCRTSEEITTSFDALQQEMSGEIDENMQKTRKQLLENFDFEVAEKLHVYKEEASASRGKQEVSLWELSKYELENVAQFNDKELSFSLSNSFQNVASAGEYSLKHGSEFAFHYRSGHPLAIHIIQKHCTSQTPHSKVKFDYSNSGKKITILESFIGRGGFISVCKLTISALDNEDYLIYAGTTESGEVLDAEFCRKMFDLPGAVTENNISEPNVLKELKDITEREKAKIVSDISERNAHFFEEEMDKLDRWAEDSKKSLELQLKDLEIEIKQDKTMARSSITLEEKIKLQRDIKNKETKRNELRKNLFESQDLVDKQKEELLDSIEKRLKQNVIETQLFTIQWVLM